MAHVSQKVTFGAIGLFGGFLVLQQGCLSALPHNGSAQHIGHGAQAALFGLSPLTLPDEIVDCDQPPNILP